MNKSGKDSDILSERAQKAFDALVDDYHRQGEHLDQDQVDRLLDKRDLNPAESLRVYERLSQEGIEITVEAEEESVSQARDSHLSEPGHSQTSLDRYKQDTRTIRLLSASEEVELGRSISLGQKALEALTAGELNDCGIMRDTIRRGMEARRRMIA